MRAQPAEVLGHWCTSVGRQGETGILFLVERSKHAPCNGRVGRLRVLVDLKHRRIDDPLTDGMEGLDAVVFKVLINQYHRVVLDVKVSVDGVWKGARL